MLYHIHVRPVVELAPEPRWFGPLDGRPRGAPSRLPCAGLGGADGGGESARGGEAGGGDCVEGAEAGYDNDGEGCPTEEAGAAAGGVAEGRSCIDGGDNQPVSPEGGEGGSAACSVAGGFDSLARGGDRVEVSAAEASTACTGGECKSTDDGDGGARERGSAGGEGEQE